MDSRFKVEVISQQSNPQRVMYAAMHQDYSEGFVWDERDQFPDEAAAGEVIIKHLLSGNRGHFGPLEHPQIVLNVGNFPHSTMQQIRTHRVGCSFDVQSFRYTGQRIIRAVESIGGVFDPGYAQDIAAIEEVFYLRPVGRYTDRQGNHYDYLEETRLEDLELVWTLAQRYADRVNIDMVSEEHARSLLPFDTRQSWVMSFNVRSLMHLLDLRAKKDAQLEAQQMCELIWPHFEAWVPAVAEWYKANRWGKARLAP